MLSRKHFIEAEKDCAKMQGLTLEAYRKSVKSIKVPSDRKKLPRRTFNDSILQDLGLSKFDLKKRKEI